MTDATGGEAVAPSGRLRAVTIASVAVHLPEANPVLVLREIEEPWRELAMPIGAPEGTAIAAALQNIRWPRPLTHDLFADVLGTYGVVIQRLVVTRLVDEVFYAELELAHGDDLRTVNCRPSDGVALVLRQPHGVPVLVADDVLGVAGRARSG